MTAQVFHARRLFTGEEMLHNVMVVVRAGLITAILQEGDPSTAKETAEGKVEVLSDGLLAPGFVDLQVNGGGGHMVGASLTPSSLQSISYAHRAYGTTTLFPTLISDSFETMVHVKNVVSEAAQDPATGIKGIHFEGPYLNMEKRGVHAPQFIRPIDDAFFDLINRDFAGKQKVTLAPECVPRDAIQTLIQAGVIVSAGHTNATYEQAMQAFSDGVSGVTHLFNAMSGFTSRAPGCVGAALDHPECYCGMIVDGYHVHDASFRIAMSAKQRCDGPQRFALVTDAMGSVGSADDAFDLNGQRIVASDGRCALPDGTLAGSHLNMAQAVRNAVSRLNLSLSEALHMATVVPAQWGGLGDRVGRIAPNYVADLVHLSDDLHVKSAWLAGHKYECGRDLKAVQLSRRTQHD